MSERDSGATTLLRDLAEAASPMLAGERLTGVGTERQVTNRRLNAEALRKGGNLAGDDPAVGMDAVVDVAHDQLAPMQFPTAHEQVEQRHRVWRSEEHTSELQSRENLVCR